MFLTKHTSYFSEFTGKVTMRTVFLMVMLKYHLGYTSEIRCRYRKEVKLTLAPNPSHLEAVDPVVSGIQDQK